MGPPQKRAVFRDMTGSRLSRPLYITMASAACSPLMRHCWPLIVARPGRHLDAAPRGRPSESHGDASHAESTVTSCRMVCLHGAHRPHGPTDLSRARAFLGAEKLCSMACLCDEVMKYCMTIVGWALVTQPARRLPS